MRTKNGLGLRSDVRWRIAGYLEVTGSLSVTRVGRGFAWFKLCRRTTAQLMQRNNILYWTTTLMVTLMTAMAGIMYFAKPEIAQAFVHLGFPDYFRKELGIAKLIAALVIVLPMVPLRVKEWAYAGLGITFTSAIIAHTAVDGIATATAPIISLVLLVASYVFLHRRQTAGAALSAF